MYILTPPSPLVPKACFHPESYLFIKSTNQSILHSTISSANSNLYSLYIRYSIQTHHIKWIFRANSNKINSYSFLFSNSWNPRIINLKIISQTTFVLHLFFHDTTQVKDSNLRILTQEYWKWKKITALTFTNAGKYTSYN